MKHGRSQPAYGILAPAARAARRTTPGRRSAWRPVSLFWRQRRKGPAGVRANRVAPAAGALWLPQFHLHFMTRVYGRPWRDFTPGLSPVTAIYQRRAVMGYQRTIVQSGMVAAQPHGAQRPVHVFSLRHAPGAPGGNVRANSAGRPVILLTATRSPERTHRPLRVLAPWQARSDSGANVQVAAPDTDSARRPGVPSTATRVSERTYHPDPGRARPDASTDAQAQTLQTLRTFKREPFLFRSRPAVTSDAVRLHSPESPAPQPDFQPQELVWRRAMPPSVDIAGNERQSGLRELAPQAQGGSFPGQGAASGMLHPFGHTPAAPALKIDSSLMDRLTDEVIRRVERRALIERARRGL